MKSLRKWLLDPAGGDITIGGRGEQHTWGNIYKEGEEAEPSFWPHLGSVILALFWSKTDSETKELDLIAPRPPDNIDGFSRWIASEFIPFWSKCRMRWQNPNKKKFDEENLKKISTTPKHRRTKKKRKTNKFLKPDNVATYAEANIVRFTSGVSTIVACLLPTVAIVILSKVQGINHLLGCLAGIVIIFAGGLIFLTSGTVSRIEVFGCNGCVRIETLCFWCVTNFAHRFSAVLVVFISNSMTMQVQGQVSIVPS